MTTQAVDTEFLIKEKNQRAAAWFWVLHGAAWLALIAYCWTMWVVSGDFKTNTIGRGGEPMWFVILVRCVEVGFGIIFTGWIVWHFIIQPKIKTGSFSFNGLFFMACLLLAFQEPWINWTTLQFLYSTTFVNFGSWLPQIPGWSSPNGQLIPMPLVYVAAYLWMLGMAAYGGSRYMAYLRRKNPAVGAARLIGQTFALMVVIDIVVELIMTRTQLISYGSTIPWLTLFAGTDHQFPIYEPLHWPGTFILLSCLHFFRDDRGRSLPERHIDRLPIRSGKLKTVARFAALAGACQLTILFAFNIPYQLWALHSGPMPQVFIDREWRTAGVCGPKTAYDCPNPKLPIARESSPTNRIVQVPHPGR
ncbi:MAG: spirocyclase AveC family protein [Sciscionella sp.]